MNPEGGNTRTEDKTMTKQELTKGAKAWCWWKSRYLYFTGREINRKELDARTGTYPTVHYYEFEDVCGAITMITDAALEKLETR